MSDLDADLYGGELSGHRIPDLSLMYLPPDLYGNDEAEYAAPPEEPETPVKSEPQDLPATTRVASPPPSKQAATHQPSPPPKQEPEDSSAPLATAQQYASNSPDSSAFNNPPTQQIPTFQDTAEYREPQQSRSETGFSQTRPVRPSEMKEEG